MSNTVLQEISVLDIAKSIGKKNKRLQAAILSALEEVMDKRSDDFKEIRKVVLDETNGYTRDVINEIFGDIEYLLR